MNPQFFTRLSSILVLVLIPVFLMPSPAAGQVKLGTKALNVAPAETKPWVVTKTPDGQPDLQGYWSNNTMTPLQRPNGVTKAFYTKEEFLEAATKQAERDGEEATPGTVEDVHYDHSQFGLDRTQGTLTPNLRTSMIIDPENGKLPPVTPEGQKRAADLAAEKRKQGPQYDQAQNLSPATRCIYMGAVPMLPPAYNNTYQIVQSPGYVMILVEELHEARIIPMDGRPHAPQSVRSWLGDSRGHWEGNTLVIETTNFNDKVAFQGGSRDLKLTERLTRTGEETMKYEFTVDDPHTWTQPWKAEMPAIKANGPIFEHACNEGNYSMKNMLAGARADEKRAAEAAAKKRKPMMRRKLFVTLLGTVLLLAALPVWPHHAFSAEFDINKPLTLKGTLAKWEMINPHSWFHVDVTGPDGKVTEWMIEGGSPNALIRLGVTKNTVKIGTELTIEAYQAKEGTTKAVGRNFILPDGSRLFLGGSAPDSTPK